MKTLAENRGRAASTRTRMIPSYTVNEAKLVRLRDALREIIKELGEVDPAQPDLLRLARRARRLVREYPWGGRCYVTRRPR